ncbi:sensor histidine kinase [Ramlibacter sp. AN1133]|uniref:sensor histidine kinase n=1 Tax=Ramlibacter sp. AN1133 TaxID=3133429 RepID=UPI0030BB49AE
MAENCSTEAAMLRKAISSAGYLATLAGSGAEALEVARRMRPAAIVTDAVMPDMDGYALCRLIRAEAALAEIPVIVLTPGRRIDDALTALACGADDLVRKPFEPGALLARIALLLANRRLRGRRPQCAIEIGFDGRMHQITAGREQILDLLFSSYAEAMNTVQELGQRQQEAHAANLELAARVVELEDANAQLRSSCHSVAHEVRSPLATIAGFSSVLLDKYGDGLDARGVRYLKAIRQETHRLSQVVEDVLYLAEMERARMSRTRTDVAEIARSLMDTLRQGRPERNVSFECVPHAWEECDERLVRIALSHLLGNAWKFTARRSHARIAFATERGPDGQTIFRVEDNGAGFDTAFAGRLFQAFERLHRDAEFEGSGVGLATAKRIVGLHQGQIWADSAPGQGATFRFTLSSPEAN